MEIANIVIVCLIALPEDLITNDLLPGRLIHRFIKDQLDRIDYITIEPGQIDGLQLAAILFDGCSDVICKILFANKR